MKEVSDRWGYNDTYDQPKIELVETEAKKAEADKQSWQQESIRLSQDNYYRGSIRECLHLLNRFSGGRDQTTHGSLLINGCTIEMVCEALASAYSDPSAYNVSELSQRIEAFVNRGGE